MPNPFDDGRPVDWSRTSEDYARHRRGYPPSFYHRLHALGVGVEGQRVLDLGTGTGLVARELARRGCKVVGVDVAEGQIEQARRLAADEGLDATFHVRPAEDTGQPTGAFDVITSSQSWHYFDRDRAVAEVKRLLAHDGRLVTCNLSWLPRLDPIARAMEALVLEHNPAWTSGDFDGEVAPIPAWVRGDLRLTGMFVYDEPILYTRESWRGRVRACRAIGASLPRDRVEAFDRAFAELLERTVPEEFTVLHRVDAHILAPR